LLALDESLVVLGPTSEDSNTPSDGASLEERSPSRRYALLEAGGTIRAGAPEMDDLRAA
jgi:hypothetical protein